MQQRNVKSQVAQARNMSIGEHRHCCVTFKIQGFVWEKKKPIVFVTYENETISIKNSLPFLKCVFTSLLCGPRADLWPFYVLRVFM